MSDREAVWRSSPDARPSSAARLFRGESFARCNIERGTSTMAWCESFGVLAPDVAPVFFCDVRVDVDRRGAFIVKAILAIFSRTRNPKRFASVDVEVVCLEPGPFQASKGAPSIADGFAGFGECDTANPRRPIQRCGFILDIHDARFRH